MVTTAQIKKLFPTARADLIKVIVDHWSEAVDAGITTPRRTRGFLSNVGVETGGLRAVEENMNYTTVANIRKTWPSRFRTDASAKPFVRNPEALAIKVYGGRLGNAAAPSTDGWDFRGGGMMQTTGRENYKKMGYEDNPEELRNPLVAFRTALREWKNRGCNALADVADWTAVRKKINGGTNGLDHMRSYMTKAEAIWPDTGSAPARPKPAAKPAPKPEPVFVVNEDQKPITDETTVRSVQTQLKALGYTEVGGIDGKIGTFTSTAITAFRKDNDLRWDPVIDKELLVALMSAKPRQLSKERTEAAPAVVRAVAPEVNSNFLSKTIAGVAAVPTAIGGVTMGVLENVPGAKGLITPLQELASDVPGWVWILLVAIAAGSIFLISQNGEKKGVEAFQAGERR